MKGRLNSIRCAVNGILEVVRTQTNAWIHAAATVVVCAAGLLAKLSVAEWGLIVFAVASVWTAEAFNTALEFLTDVASPEFHPTAGKAKDAAAGAVLISAIGATVVGVLVFGPKLMRFIHG